MKRNKKEIIVRDEQQIEEKSAMAENCHAPFSRDEQIEISETTNNQEPISKIQTDLSEGVQINIEEAMSEAEEQRKDAPPVKNEDEQINEAEEAVAGRKSKKKRWTSLILMLINIAIVAVIIITQVKGNNMVPLTEILESGINWWFLLACVASFAVMTILEGIRIEIFVHDSTKKHQFPLSFKTAQIGRYYDCVTPLSTGGQPFQIYYLKKHGLSAAQSVAVPMGRYVFTQITAVIFFTAVLFSTFSGSLGGGVATTVVSAASWVGYVLNCSVIFLVLLLSINRKVGTKIVGWFIKIGHKMKLVKNYDKTYNNVIKVVDDFQSSIKYYVKSPKTFIVALLVTGGSYLLNYTIPFFIYCTFAGFEVGMWSTIIVRCVMIDLASSFIPLPGGTGAAELSFTTLFASFFVGGKLFWALLLWRILTYYGYIFQGLIIMIYDYAIGDKKYNWQKRKNELETESEKFKAEQLSQFKSRKLKKQKNK